MKALHSSKHIQTYFGRKYRPERNWSVLVPPVGLGQVNGRDADRLPYGRCHRSSGCRHCSLPRVTALILPLLMSCCTSHSTHDSSEPQSSERQTGCTVKSTGNGSFLRSESHPRRKVQLTGTSKKWWLA